MDKIPNSWNFVQKNFVGQKRKNSAFNNRMDDNKNPIREVLKVQANKLRGNIEQTTEAVEEIKNNERPSNIHTVQGTRYLFKGFRIGGIYMPEKNRVLYVIYASIIHVFVTIYLPIGFFLSYKNMSGSELQIGNLLTSLQVAVNILGSSIKVVIMAFLVPNLLSCHHIIERLDKRCSTDEEFAEIKRFIKRGNRFVVLFAMAYWSYSSSTLISAVIFQRLPYNMYNPFVDAKSSTFQFILAGFLEMFLLDICCFQEVVDDSYAVIYVSILRLHLGILLKRIENLNKNPLMTLDENFEELKLCIIDHKNIIELYDVIAPVISITIFVQYSITAIILGTTLINILLFATNFASIVASCFYVIAVVVEILPLCYYSQCLMDESNRLAEVIFHSNWLNQDPRYRKMLIFFMQRSQRTMEFLAGKLFPITLASFLSIAKFSFSLYTFIKRMGIEERFGLK